MEILDRLVTTGRKNLNLTQLLGLVHEVHWCRANFVFGYKCSLSWEGQGDRTPSELARLCSGLQLPAKILHEPWCQMCTLVIWRVPRFACMYWGCCCCLWTTSVLKDNRSVIQIMKSAIYLAGNLNITNEADNRGTILYLFYLVTDWLPWHNNLEIQISPSFRKGKAETRRVPCGAWWIIFRRRLHWLSNIVESSDLWFTKHLQVAIEGFFCSVWQEHG